MFENQTSWSRPGISFSFPKVSASSQQIQHQKAQINFGVRSILDEVNEFIFAVLFGD